MNWACQPTPNSPKSTNMQFRVNPEMLEDSLHLNRVGVSFSPPINFERVDPEGSSILETVEENFISSIRNFTRYRDTFNKAEMYVIQPDTNSGEDFLSYHTNWLDSLSGQDSIWQSALTDSFPYNDFQVKQLLLQNEQVVSFFLLFSPLEAISHKPFLVMYSVLRESYTSSVIQSIESSIGSFTPL